jgi:hypothetical protein
LAPAYMANLLLGIVLMFSPQESSTAVWTQLLTVYSLLISGIIAIGEGSLSRFHSGMTIFLVMSPLVGTPSLHFLLNVNCHIVLSPGCLRHPRFLRAPPSSRHHPVKAP